MTHLLRALGLPIAVSVVLVGPPVEAASRAPRALTPAHPAGLGAPTPACPTFRWTPVDGAEGYELALYALPLTTAAPGAPERAPTGEPVLRVSVGPEAAGWTPPDAWCLAPERSYAWAVRALAVEPGAWSEPALFRVHEAAAPARVAELVASLRDLVGEDEARAMLRELIAGEGSKRAPAPASAPLGSRQPAPTPTAADPSAGHRLTAKGNAGGPVSLGAHFAGTEADQDFELRVGGTPALVLQGTGGVPTIKGGFSGNTIEAGIEGAVIAGGGSPDMFSQNRVTDHWGTVGGGRGNVAGNGTLLLDDRMYATVGGGQGNQATGFAATVGGGSANMASGSSAAVAGGATALASGASSAVGGGSNNHATGVRSAIPGGRDARAEAHGQLAYSSGGFDPTAGDAQWSLYVARATTADTTPTGILLDAFFPIGVAAGRTLAFQIQVAARSDAGEAAGWEIAGVIENVGGTVAFVGTPTVSVLGKDDPAWDVMVAADDTLDTLSIVATGAAGTTIRWVAVVRTAEVAF